MNKKALMNLAIVRAHNSYHAAMGNLKSAKGIEDISPREALAFLGVFAQVAGIILDIAKLQAAENKAKEAVDKANAEQQTNTPV